MEQIWICQLKTPSLHHSISVSFLSFYRIHHNQIVVNKVLVPVIDSLREHAKARVHQLRVSTFSLYSFFFYPFVSLNLLTPRMTNSKFKTIQLVVFKTYFPDPKLLVISNGSILEVGPRNQELQPSCIFRGMKGLRLRTYCVLTMLSYLYCLQRAENCTNCSN